MEYVYFIGPKARTATEIDALDQKFRARVLPALRERVRQIDDEATAPVVKALAEAVVKLGRPPSGNARVAVTLRVEPRVLEAFQAMGPNWRAAMVEALTAACPD